MMEPEYPPPFSLPSGSTQWLFQGAAAASKFLAVIWVNSQGARRARHDGSWLPSAECQLQCLDVSRRLFIIHATAGALHPRVTVIVDTHANAPSPYTDLRTYRDIYLGV